MVGSNRAKNWDQIFKLLRKSYEPRLPSDRPLLEQALFGVCLEDAPLEAAEAAFERLKQDYFDWNELRVSVPRELAQSLAGLAEPLERARRIKAILQSLFESRYEFDLEWLRRKTLGEASRELRKIEGVTPFVEAFVLQAGLRGHTIPLDETTLRVLRRLDLAAEDTDLDVLRGSLERLIPKARGPAFCSMVRQLAFDVCLPEEPDIDRCVLAEICPTARRLRAEESGADQRKAVSVRKAGSARHRR